MCSGLGWFKVVGVCVGERRGGVREREVWKEEALDDLV